RACRGERPREPEDDDAPAFNKVRHVEVVGAEAAPWSLLLVELREGAFRQTISDLDGHALLLASDGQLGRRTPTERGSGYHSLDGGSAAPDTVGARILAAVRGVPSMEASARHYRTPPRSVAGRPPRYAEITIAGDAGDCRSTTGRVRPMTTIAKGRHAC